MNSERFRAGLFFILTITACFFLSCDTGGGGGGNTFEYDPPQPVFNNAPYFHVGRMNGMAAGDFNEDGSRDLVFSLWAENMLKLYLHNGADGFQDPVYLPSVFHVDKIIAGDFNADGTLDILAYMFYSGTVNVQLGDGTGGFAAPVSSDLGVGIYHFLLTGLFDGDAFLDLVFINETPASYDIHLAKGNGDGTFASAGAPILTSTTLYSGMDAGLVDGDFNLDLVAETSDDFMVMTGNGDGTFNGPSVVSGDTYTGKISIADVNDDGDNDLVSLYSGFCSIYPEIRYTTCMAVRLGAGDGTFGARSETYVGGGSYEWLKVEDINDDGNPDVLAYGFFGLVVLPGNGDGTFKHRKVWLVGGYIDEIYDADFADYNGDSLPDIVIFDSGFAMGVYTVYGNGNGTFQAPRGFDTNGADHVHVLADFNGDGNLDFLGGEYYNATHARAVVGLGRGDGTFRRPITTFDPSIVNGPPAAGDLNGDGLEDFVSINPFVGYSEVFSSNGDGTFTIVPQSVDLTYPGGAFWDLVDMDHDGELDLVSTTGAAYVYNLGVWRGNGDATFAEPDLYLAVGSNRALVTGDLNDDGWADVALFGGHPSVTVFLNQGDGSLGDERTYTLPTDYVSWVSIGDINNDGVGDLAAALNIHGGVSILYGHRSGVLGPEVSIPVGEGVYGVTIADINADGYNDLLANNDPFITMFLGTPTGDLIPGPQVPGGSPLPNHKQVVGDVNNDGLLDLVYYGTSTDAVYFIMQQ